MEFTAANSDFHRALRTPRNVEGYELVQKIGAGGMSAVYEAISPNGSHVALKLLHPALADTDLARQRLRREVAMLQRVQGKHVAQILDAELDGENLFIVTELIAGPTLETDVRQDGRYTQEDLYQLGVKLGEALESIHLAGVLHRDLKPSNVMLANGEPVLIDFGISQMGADSRLTQTGFLTHTPGFCDPRVLRGTEPDAAADWWAMAAVLAYAATGTHPFGSGLPAVVMNRVLNANPDLPLLSSDLAAVFTQALAKDLRNRLKYSELLAAVNDSGAAAKIAADSVFESGGAEQGNSFAPENNGDTGGAETAEIQRHREYEDEHEHETLRFAEFPAHYDGNGEATAVFPVSAKNDLPQTQILKPAVFPPVAGFPQAASPPLNFPSDNVSSELPDTAAPAFAYPVSRPAGAYVPAGEYRTAGEYRAESGVQNAAAGYSVPHLQNHPSLILLLGAVLISFGMSAPIFVYLLAVAAGVVLDAVGAMREKLVARRIRRGRAGGSDSGVLLAFLPVALLRGFFRSVFSGVLGALGGFMILLVAARIFGEAPIYDSDSGVGFAAVLKQNLQEISAGNPAAVLIGISAALLIYWIFPSSREIRMGTKVVFTKLAPANSLYVFWLLLFFAMALCGLWLNSLGGAVSWNPLLVPGG